MGHFLPIENLNVDSQVAFSGTVTVRPGGTVCSEIAAERNFGTDGTSCIL